MLIYSHRKLSKGDTVAEKASVGQSRDGPHMEAKEQGPSFLDVDQPLTAACSQEGASQGPLERGWQCRTESSRKESPPTAGKARKSSLMQMNTLDIYHKQLPSKKEIEVLSLYKGPEKNGRNN